MLIGIDMLGVQSPGSRGRGIGRLGRNLVAHLLAADPSVEFLLYGHDDLPTDAFPSAPNARIGRIGCDPALGEVELAEAMERLARENPDRLDAFVLLSPQELHGGHGPPAKPLNGLTMAAVVHDLIPFHYQERYLTCDVYAPRFYRNLERLRNYDVLLANSDATRDDFLSMLHIPAHKVITIGAACDSKDFEPDLSVPMHADARRALHGLGIEGPFLYSLTNVDYHKNLLGLIDAFALLPADLRRSHQLVLTCSANPGDVWQVREHAGKLGVHDRLILTGAQPDSTLRVLYQRCAAFAFPSLYEGFGLPLLEAMHCGAPVVAGNNSSQIEVVGDAGLLANVGDAGDLAAKLARVLTEPGLAEDLRRRALVQAWRFSWEHTAGKALGALTEAVERKSSRRFRGDRAHSARPRLAVFSPFAPKRSGISDYSGRLIDRLKATYAIDLYHDSGYTPDPALASAEFGCFDHRLFARNAPLLDYRGVLYQMGNSHYHKFIYEALLRHPGIVTLHDFCLAGFQWWYSHTLDGTAGHFLGELDHFRPARSARLAALLHDLMREPGGIQVACAKRGVHLNRRVFERSERVILHSAWGRRQARETFPEFDGLCTHIHHGATALAPTPAQRAAVRERFGLPPTALIFASMGIMTRDKMNDEAIAAFGAIASEFPDAMLLFIGLDIEGGEALRKAEGLGLRERVRFLGRQGADDFADLIAAIDVGVNLRRPPTYGETSGALLDLLRRGVPTIVTDVATFSDYPDDVVRKVRWGDDGMPGLIAALRGLAGDPPTRAALGRAAIRHVHEVYDWDRSAAAYVEVIESTHAERSSAGANRAPTARRLGVSPVGH